MLWNNVMTTIVAWLVGDEEDGPVLGRVKDWRVVICILATNMGNGLIWISLSHKLRRFSVNTLKSVLQF